MEVQPADSLLNPKLSQEVGGGGTRRHRFEEAQVLPAGGQGRPKSSGCPREPAHSYTGVGVVAEGWRLSEWGWAGPFLALQGWDATPRAKDSPLGPLSPSQYFPAPEPSTKVTSWQ